MVTLTGAFCVVGVPGFVTVPPPPPPLLFPPPPPHAAFVITSPNARIAIAVLQRSRLVPIASIIIITKLSRHVNVIRPRVVHRPNPAIGAGGVTRLDDAA